MITQTHHRGNIRVLEKVEMWKNFPVSLSSLRKSNFGAFGGPMARATFGYYVGRHGCSNTRIVTK